MTSTSLRVDRRAVGVAAVLLLVLALAGVAARSAQWASERPSAPVAVQPLPTEAPPTPQLTLPPVSPEQTAEHLDSWVFRAIAAAVAVFIAGCFAGAAWLFWPRLRWRPRWWRRAPADEHVDEAAAASVAEAVDRALLLVDEPDARNAIVRAWLLLGAAAAAAGTPPRRTETSREYAGRLAAQHGLPTRAVERLAGLYREARFSAHDMRPDQREQARTDLLALRAALQAPAALADR